MANIPIVGVQLKNYSRINFEMGIIYYEDNLYFKKDNSCWCAFKVGEYSYDFESNRGKMNIHNKLTKLYWNVIEEFHQIDIPIETSVVEDNEELKKKVKGNLKKQAIAEIDETTEYLLDILGDKGNKYETYLIFKLKTRKDLFRTIKEFGQSLIQDPIRMLNKLSGLDKAEIHKREYEVYKYLEEQTYDKANRLQKIKRCNEYDIQKLIKYLFYFGIGSPPIVGPKPTKKKKIGRKQKFFRPNADIVIKNGKEYIRPEERQLLRMTECDIDIKRPRSIKIGQFYKGRHSAAHQAYLSISNMPDGSAPGGEWQYYLKQSLDFPIYTSIRGRIVDNKAAQDELNRKKREIDDQEEHIRSSQGVQVPQDVIDKIDDAAELEDDLKTKQFPLIFTSMIICVAAANLEELEKRVDAIKNTLDPITCEVPAGDQFLMMNEAMIGGEIFQKDYILRIPPDQLALTTPGASIEVGDDDGFYYAVAGSLRKPVRIAPWLPALMNKPPCISLIGAQGGGKSFAADLLLLKTVKYYGAHALVIDPKGDRTKWPELFASFGDEIKVTTFSSEDEDLGKLDPYIIMRSNVHNSRELPARMKEATVMAMDICMFLLGVTRKDASRVSILTEATKMAEVSENPAMTRIIDALEGHILEKAKKEEDVIKASLCREMATTLKSFKKMAFAGLLFGEGNEEAADLSKQVNVLQIQNLKFPAKGKLPEDFSFDETIGYACLLAITGYVTKFVQGDRSIVKIFTVDESKVINRTPAGRNAINSLTGMARAMNAIGIFIGQLVEHIGDDNARNSIAYKFAFKSTDMREIKNILEYFNLEETQDNIDLISNLENGTCLFQDHYGRTAVILVDYVFDEYLIGLDTTPPEQAVAGGA